MAEDPIEIQFRNPVKQLGFAQLEHVISKDPELSDGAKVTFLMFLSYAHQNEKCWPSIQRIAEDRNKTTTTISRHNKELERLGYITRNRRMGRSSITIIEDVEQIPRLWKRAEAELQKRNEHKNDTTDITKMSRKTSQKWDVEEEPVKNNQGKNKKRVPPSKSQKRKPRVSAGSRKEQTGVTVYRSMTKLYPPDCWREDLETITDLDRWRQVIKMWLGSPYQKTNVAGMFECYTENRLPTTKGAKRAESRGGYKQHQEATPETVAAFRAHRAEKRRAAGVEEVRPGAGSPGR